MDEAAEFKFASGNMNYWMVVTREELIGADGRKFYSNGPITVTASSDSDQPYQGKSPGLGVSPLPYIVSVEAGIRRREFSSQDPNVCMGWYKCVYTEDSQNDKLHLLVGEGGMDVFIRTL